MSDSTAVVEITPGIDHSRHTEDLHQKVASSVGQIQGQPVAPLSVVPAIDDKPSIPPNLVDVEDDRVDPKNIKPRTEHDIEDARNRWFGRPGVNSTQPWRDFWQKRQLQQHPGGEIVEEKK